MTVFCDNETDWVYLKQLLGIRKERSYKNETIGEARVISFKRFMEMLYENRNSFNGPRADGDDAPAG